MSKEDVVHLARINRGLQRNLELLEERIHSFIDPKVVPSQDLFDLLQQRIKVREQVVQLAPRYMVEAVENFESWYAEHGLPVPEPEHIEKIKKFWQEKAGPRKKTNRRT